MKFNKLSSIDKKTLRDGLDKKEIRDIRRLISKNNLELHFDVEVGSDVIDNHLSYIALNLNYVDLSARDMFIESYEVLAVEDIPTHKTKEINLIESLLIKIGEDLTV